MLTSRFRSKSLVTRKRRKWTWSTTMKMWWLCFLCYSVWWMYFNICRYIELRLPCPTLFSRNFDLLSRINRYFIIFTAADWIKFAIYHEAYKYRLRNMEFWKFIECPIALTLNNLLFLGGTENILNVARRETSIFLWILYFWEKTAVAGEMTAL